MSDYVLDCCTLLNLYCGWGGIGNLASFGTKWCIGQQALAEAKYVRDFEKGLIVPRPLTPEDLHQQYPLTVLPVGPIEAGLIVKLAAYLDDGEAEGLALASCKGLSFCSDDAPVLATVATLSLSVSIVSTPELLLEWAGSDPARTAQLPSIVKRISALSRFTPHRSSTYLSWWQSMLSHRALPPLNGLALGPITPKGNALLANIKSQQIPEFDCRVKAEPVLETENYKVYELVDSCVSNNINVGLGGTSLGKTRHIALDVNGIGHLFDIGQRSLFDSVGPCVLLVD